MDEPFIAEIMEFAGNFAPDRWALCSGQILQIQQNTALYSLIGTYYGGDGRNTFALPDLRPTVNGQKQWPPGQPVKCIALQGIYPPRP